MLRTSLPWLFAATLAVSPIGRADGADSVWPPHAVVGLNSVLLEAAATSRGDVAVVYAAAGPFLGPVHQVTLEAATRVEGSVVAPGIQLAVDAVVDGTIRASAVAGAPTPRREPDSALRFPLTLDLPTFPRFIPGQERVDVTAGQTQSLRPGSYGVLFVAGRSRAGPAAIVLGPGAYDFEQVELGPGARLECTAACEIRVENRLVSGDASYLGPAPRAGVTPGDVVVFVGGYDGQTGRLREDPPAAAFADGSVLEARLYVPNGTVRLGARARATGRLVARDVLVGRGATVAVDSGPTREDDRAAERGPLLLREAGDVQAVQGQVRTASLLPGVVVAAQGFFERYGESLGLGPDDAMVELSALTDHRGHVHHRFEQRHRGVPVFGVGYLLEEVDGRIAEATGRIIAGLDIQPTPTLTDEQALSHALAALPPRAYAWEEPGARGPLAQRPRGRLGIGSVDHAMTAGRFRLVYRFDVSSVKPRASETLDVDAHTGEVVGRFGTIRRQTVPSQGDTLYYGTRSFLAEKFNQNPDQYWLRVPPGGGLPEISTLLRVSDTGGDDDFWSFIRDQNDFSYWPAPDRATAETKLPDLLYGVSLHWGIQRALEYLKPFEVQAWWSPIIAVLAAHKNLMPGGNDSSPRYDPNEDAMYFPRTGEGAELVSLVVIGHEFTHGLRGHVVPDLVYFGESGAVEEGLADVFGLLLSAKEVGTVWCDDVPVHAIQYKDPGGDGSCAGGTAPCPGEQCDPVAGVCTQVLPAKCLFRNHAQPKTTGNPDTYLGTNYVAVSGACAEGGECHRNATIAGHWLYILVNGKAGTNDLKQSYSVQGIGFEKAGTVVVDTMLLKLWGAATFADVRAATIQVATQKFGPKSPEVVAVANAWYAVGVGDAYDLRSYTPAGLGGVEPWPAALTWSTLSDEFDWQAQVSTSPKFDTDVRTVSADSSLVVPGAPGQLKLGAHVNLRPAAKYYWRVRAKAAAPASSGGAVAIPTGPIIPTTPSSGRMLALSHGSTTPPMTLPPVIPAPPDALWGPWGNTQAFVTAAKIPHLYAPAPMASTSAVTAPMKLVGAAGGGLEPPVPAPPAAPPVAEGSYYPWKTKFGWGTVPGATQYRLTASTSSVHECDQTHLTAAGQHTVVDMVAATTTPTHEVVLRSGRTYRWWLKVFGPEGIPGGCAFAGSPVKFSTSTPTTTLVSPPDGSKVSPFAVHLAWKETAGAAGYQVELVDEAATGASVVAETTTASVTIQASKTGSFQWRVRPKGPLAGDVGAYTAPWTFIADKSLTKPKLNYPLEEHYPHYGLGPELQWWPVEGAAGYRATLYNRNADGTPGSVAFEGPGGQPHPYYPELVYVLPPVVLTTTTGYCWKVAAEGPEGLQGVDSDVHCFDLGAARPTLAYPPDGATGIEYQPTTHFAWSSPYAPKGFRFSWGACPSDDDLGGLDLGAGQTHELPGLSPNTWYCWRVLGISPNGAEVGPANPQGFEFLTKAAPKPACKTLDTGSILWQSPIRPPNVLLMEVTRPVYLQWVQTDPAISAYRVVVTSIKSTGPVAHLDAVHAASAIPQGSSKVFLVPINIHSTENLEWFALSVYARAGSDCNWDFVGGVTNVFIK